MTSGTSLTAGQRERLTTDLEDVLKLALERGLEIDEYESAENAIEELDDYDDDDVVELWTMGVGAYLEQALEDENSKFSEAWRDADVGGLYTPTQWQLEKILNGEGTDYTIPTVGNVLSDLIQSADSLEVGHERLEFLLQTHGMDVDSDGYIINQETGDFKEPYTFQAHSSREFIPFKEGAHDSEEDPLEDRLAEMREETGEHHRHRSDRVHTDDFGGILPGGILPGTDEPQILKDNWYEMLSLASAGALTSNMKGLSPETPVLTTSDLCTAYTHDSEALTNSDSEERV